MSLIIHIFDNQLIAINMYAFDTFLVRPGKTGHIIPIQGQVGILEKIQILSRDLQNVTGPVGILLQCQVGVFKTQVLWANEATVAFFDFLSTGNRRYHGQAASNQGQ